MKFSAILFTSALSSFISLGAAARPETQCNLDNAGMYAYCTTILDNCTELEQVASEMCEGYRRWTVQPQPPHGDYCTNQGDYALAYVICRND